MIVHNQRSQLFPQRLRLLASVLFLTIFLVIAIFRTAFAEVNMDINAWAVTINTSSFTGIAIGIDAVFDTTILVVLSFIASAILFLKTYWRYSVLLLCTMAGDAILVVIFKNLIMSPRPINEIVANIGYSFPSGHVTGSVVFFGVLTYFLWKHSGSAKVKASTAGFYVAITAVVGFDRIYLNVHWFSDVIGGVFLGGFWLLLCISVFEFLLSKSKIQPLTNKVNRRETKT